MRAGLHTRRSLTRRQAVRAHVALTDNPFLTVIFRNIVWAGQSAVLATKTLIVEVLDNPRNGILLVRIDGTRRHAGRIKAVMAGRRDMLHHRVLTRPANQQADVTPRLVVVEPVQRMAGGNTRLAA